jgi:hypothetical protein
MIFGLVHVVKFVERLGKSDTIYMVYRMFGRQYFQEMV